MPFSITAELLLGTYHGHGADGGVDRMPSVARLHSALVCAAGFGPRAQERDGTPGLSAVDEAALRWLEDNPPDAVGIPSMRVNRGGALAYRDDGTLKRSKGAAAIKKFPKSADSSVAVDGPLTWTWGRTPPEPVVAALEALCPDVPHLGTTETPVRLTTSRSAPEPTTHVLEPEAALFAGSGEDIDVPAPGRVDELTAAHAQARGPVPTVRQDAVTANETSQSPGPPQAATRPARYAPVTARAGDGPWTEAWVMPLTRLRPGRDRREATEPVPERDKVRWAVVLHRALIAALGSGVPPLLTGAYPAGAPRPANRVALHLIDGGSAGVGAPTALAVLLPRNAESADLEAVDRALRSLRTFRGPRGVMARVGPVERRPGGRFWPEPPAGTVRLWRTSPPAVPDTRGHGADWTFVHAALLSLGFVWQNGPHLPRIAGRGESRYRAMIGAVNAAGAAVIATSPLRTSEVQHYVHRVHEHAVVRPYHATLSTGDLGGPRTVQAIGQSRHLGGGLLVPFDLPEGTLVDAITEVAQ